MRGEGLWCTGWFVGAAPPRWLGGIAGADRGKAAPTGVVVCREVLVGCGVPRGFGDCGVLRGFCRSGSAAMVGGYSRGRSRQSHSYGGCGVPRGFGGCGVPRGFGDCGVLLGFCRSGSAAMVGGSRDRSRRSRSYSLFNAVRSFARARCRRDLRVPSGQSMISLNSGSE